MKIAILTMQRILNFGSVLQAYSLRQIIREVADVDAVFLDIDYEKTVSSICSVLDSVDYDVPADYPEGILENGKRWIIARLSWMNKQLIKKFMRNELKLDSTNGQNTYDHVIVGSDEVFNHKKGVCLQLHGAVPQGGNVFSYAASCGSACLEDIQQNDLQTVKNAMQNFSAVSVRDTATEKYVSSLYTGEVTRHLDPVLVGDLYKRKHRPVGLKNYLLVYAYGQRIRTREEIQAIQEFARSRKLKTVAVGGSQFWCDLYIPVSPMRLLDYFHYADFIVTDTFHGTVFSVINRKKFGVIIRNSNRNKIEGLLEDLNLEKRVISHMNQTSKVLSEEIDYEKVEAILQMERVRTRTYLAQQLGKDYVADNTI